MIKKNKVKKKIFPKSPKEFIKVIINIFIFGNAFIDFKGRSIRKVLKENKFAFI